MCQTHTECPLRRWQLSAQAPLWLLWPCLPSPSNTLRTCIQEVQGQPCSKYRRPPHQSWNQDLALVAVLMSLFLKYLPSLLSSFSESTRGLRGLRLPPRPQEKKVGGSEATPEPLRKLETHPHSISSHPALQPLYIWKKKKKKACPWDGAHPLLLQKTQVWFPVPTWLLIISITPVPGDPMLSSDR